MSDWKRRLKENLEPDLLHPEARARLSAYHNMPYAIFCYPPDAEFPLRQELQLLSTRLEQSGKRVTTVSLAECLEEALGSQGLTVERVAAAEQRTGTDRMIDTVHQVISRRLPLDDLVVKRIPADARPEADVVFVVRAGALFPFYRTSSLLEQLTGKVTVPAVLFYPGVLDGVAGLKFMGVLDPDHNYRPKIY